MTKLDQLQIVLRECIEEHRTPAIFDAIAQVFQERAETEDTKVYYDSSECDWYILRKSARAVQSKKWEHFEEQIGALSDMPDPRPIDGIPQSDS